MLSAVLFLLLYGFGKQRSSAGIIDAAQALKFFYIISAALFILGLKGLSSPKFARKGMFLAEFGMGMAVVGTLFHHEIVTYQWIIIGLIIGSIFGGTMGPRIPM